MGTTLHTLAPAPGATRKRKRVGRGPGSGIGKTSGRGQKGQKARAGHHGARVGFEGGQMPMARRLPKRGFKNLFRVETHAVNLGQIQKIAQEMAEAGEGSVIGIDALRQAGLVPKRAKVVKILGDGDIGSPVTVQAHRFSKSARDKLAAAGGQAEIIDLGREPNAATSNATAPAPDGAE